MSGIRILVSYSHDSPEHKARVRQIGDSLRRYGLDVRLDQYLNQDPLEGWPLWMEKEIELAQKVLLVCTETYLRRVRKEEVEGVGRGVCWEANLIYAELYES
ncbi:TIR domain-containing protein [bacterium]|nr:TIR domain-containing protein [bacterium]